MTGGAERRWWITRKRGRGLGGVKNSTYYYSYDSPVVNLEEVFDNVKALNKYVNLKKPHEKLISSGENIKLREKF